MARLASHTSADHLPSQRRIAFSSVRDTILKAIRARVGWVWLVRLVYGTIVHGVAAWHVPGPIKS